MRIVFPLLTMNSSGGMRVTIQYANGLAQRGHHVTIILPQDALFANVSLNENVQCLRLNRHEVRQKWEYLPLVYSLGRAVPPCDVIIVNSWQALYPALIARMRFRCRLVLLVQNHPVLGDGRSLDRSAFLKWRVGLGMKLAYQAPIDHVAVSTLVANSLLEDYGKKAHLAPNGVDIHTFYPDKPLELSDPNSRWVLVLGRTMPAKGYLDAVEAIRIARRQEPRLKMLLVSKEVLPLPDDVPYRQVAPKNDQELRAYYSTADVFFFSSLFEGFGLPPLEAMACGVPVVTTDCGGVRDFALHEKNCLIVPIQDPQVAAEAITRLLTDVPLRQQLISQGIETAKRFRLETAIESFSQIIESLL